MVTKAGTLYLIYGIHVIIDAQLVIFVDESVVVAKNVQDRERRAVRQIKC